jgi:hypothetical protein
MPQKIGRCGMSFAAREACGLRRSEGIGLWALDRGAVSCVWRTRACRDCYNRRISWAYKAMGTAWLTPDGSDSARWARARSEAFSGLSRVRLCTRGEAFASPDDVFRVRGWISANPSTLFWIPTRAWCTGLEHGWNYGMVSLLEREILPLSNARVMASVDPFTAHMMPGLVQRGFSTMYFESYEIPSGYVSGVHPGAGYGNVIKCRKTWSVRKDPATGRLAAPHGLCRSCGVCFGTARVDVWLRNHSSVYSLENIKNCK